MVGVTCASILNFKLLVYARFRVKQSDYQGEQLTRRLELELGSRVHLDTIRSSIQTATNTNAEWIPSRLVRQDARTYTFELNSSRRWYYGWRSGKNNTQRSTTHVLEAVVLVVPSPTAAVVVARTMSSPFTISSFRRCAQGAPVEPPRQQPTIREAVRTPTRVTKDYATSRHRPVTLIDMPDLSTTSKIYYHHDENMTDSSTPVSRVHADEGNSPIVVDLVQRKAHDLDSFSSTIGALFACLERIPLDTFAGLIPIWSEYRCASVRAVMSTNHIAAAAVNFAFWLTIDTSLRNTLDQFAADAVVDLLDIEALRGHFDRWMRWLLMTSKQFLATYDTSLPVIDVVVSALLDIPDLHAFRYLHMFDWENFIARVRLLAISTSKCLRAMRSLRSHEAERDGITGNWFCLFPPDVENLCHSHQPDHLSVAAAFVFWQQLSNICLHWDLRSRTLWIVSHQGYNSTSRLATRLVLDGLLRSFNVLPHGESTLGAGVLLGGQCFGDYVGSINQENIIHATCYSWLTSAWGHGRSQLTEAAYRWEWNVQPVRRRNENTLQVKVRISIGFLSMAESKDFACQSARKRIEMVSTWNPVYQTCCFYQPSIDICIPSRIVRSSNQV